MGLAFVADHMPPVLAECMATANQSRRVAVARGRVRDLHSRGERPPESIGVKEHKTPPLEFSRGSRGSGPRRDWPLNPTHVIGGYREFAPGAEATGFCESVWIHQTPYGPVPAGGAHRILPEMGVSLAFQGFRDADGRPRAWSPILAGPKLRAA